jgi:hypothetical protein
LELEDHVNRRGAAGAHRMRRRSVAALAPLGEPWIKCSYVYHNRWPKSRGELIRHWRRFAAFFQVPITFPAAHAAGY